MKKKILLFLLVVLTVITVNINLSTNVPIIDSWGTKSDILLINLILYAILFKKSFSISNKRLIIITSIIAVVIAVSQIIGYNIANYYTIRNIYSTHELLIKNILKFIGLSILFYAILVFVFSKIELRI